MHPRLRPLYQSTARRAVPIMTHPGVELIGKRVRDCVTDGTNHAAAILAVAELYPTAASTTIMDLTVEAEAFGATVALTDDEVPAVTGRLVHDYPSVAALAVPELCAGRLPQYLEAARLAVGGISDRPVLAGCIGPFSLAARLFGMTETMTAAYLEPETLSLLIEKCTHFLLDYVQALKQTGAHGAIMAEPASGLLSPQMCDHLSSSFVSRIVDAVQDDGFLFVLHNCGNRGHVTASMVSTGARGLHLGNQADMVQALREIPTDRLVFGNLDPAGTLKMATPTEVGRATRQLLAATAPYPNFVLSTGCDTPPGVPEANIQAFFEALQPGDR